MSEVKWIDANSDIKPKKYKQVLVCIRCGRLKRIAIGEWWGKRSIGWVLTYDEIDVAETITHWVFLPKLPNIKK